MVLEFSVVFWAIALGLRLVLCVRAVDFRQNRHASFFCFVFIRMTCFVLRRHGALLLKKKKKTSVVPSLHFSARGPAVFEYVGLGVLLLIHGGVECERASVLRWGGHHIAGRRHVYIKVL